MGIYELLSIIATIAGLVFLFVDVDPPVPNNKRIKHIPKRVKRIILFILCVIIAVIIYYIGHPKVPLTSEEKEKFKTTIFSIAGAFRLNPIAGVSTSKNTLEELKREIEKKPRYEKEMPQETAILYRLYSANILFSVNFNKPFDRTYIDRAYPCINKSFNLDKKIWEKPHEKSSYEFLKSAFKNKKQSLLAEQLIFTMFTMAMIGADEAEVRNAMKPIWEAIVSLAGKPKIDLEYLINYRREGFKGFSYEELIETLRITIVGQGGKFNGPSFVPMPSGETLVTYIVSPKDKPQVKIEWIVDKNKNSIEPKSIYAEALRDIVMTNEKN